MPDKKAHSSSSHRGHVAEASTSTTKSGSSMSTSGHIPVYHFPTGTSGDQGATAPVTRPSSNSSIIDYYASPARGSSATSQQNTSATVARAPVQSAPQATTQKTAIQTSTTTAPQSRWSSSSSSAVPSKRTSASSAGSGHRVLNTIVNTNSAEQAMALGAAKRSQEKRAQKKK